MRAAVRKLRDVLESGDVTLLIGVALVVTSLFEFVDSRLEQALGVEIDAHHGVSQRLRPDAWPRTVA